MDKTKIVRDVFNTHAETYRDKFMDVSLYHDSLDVFCDSLPADSAILELACGPGNITRYLLDKMPGLKIHGIDIAENMIALAKENCPEATFQLMDCRDIGKLDNKFNGVMAGFVFPYLSKEECIRVIADSAQVLESKGMIYISTMEDDYSTSGWKTSSKGDKVYMYNHEESYLAGALRGNGFEITGIQRKEYMGWESKKVVDLIIVAKLN